MVMASLDNGMSLMNTEAFWQPIIKGSILVLAVGVDMATRQSRRH
jgi:D-xylose transport system permease protein